MSEVLIRREGKAGCITLNRPAALNAMTHGMCRAIDGALIDWASDTDVHLVLIDGAGPKAFCAGGDLGEIHATGGRGDYRFAQRFWRDEYRMNLRIAEYPKPVVSFLHGFTMGGGVGLGCHGSLRLVGASSRIAMPECGIGLIPDVGGSFLLARMSRLVPGLGAWLGTTGTRMEPGDALLGFADRFDDESDWQDSKARMIETGVPNASVQPRPPSAMLQVAGRMGEHFRPEAPEDILHSLDADDAPEAQAAAKAFRRAAPLAVAAHLEILRRLGPDPDLREALRLEYRYTFRAPAQGDFLEGIRAQIIDKDRNPRWRHARHSDVTGVEVEAMLAPLGDDELSFEGE